jgi:hypothetical protein
MGVIVESTKVLLAQLIDRKALNLVIPGSTLTVDVNYTVKCGVIDGFMSICISEWWGSSSIFLCL